MHNSLSKNKENKPLPDFLLEFFCNSILIFQVIAMDTIVQKRERNSICNPFLISLIFAFAITFIFLLCHLTQIYSNNFPTNGISFVVQAIEH
jgi:hypothetical protein